MYILLKNGYPIDFILKLSRKYNDPVPFGPEKKRVYLELLFLGDNICKCYEKDLRNFSSAVYFYVSRP